MDSFELNKIIGALLGVVFVVFSVNLLSDAIFHTSAPATPGYAIAVPESGEADGDAPAAAESVLPLLASADPAAGETVFRRCQACHTVEQGGPNKVGPNLWNIVNAPAAHLDNFSYSAAVREYAQEGEVWDYENLDHFLLNPRGFLPGTAMSFAGLRNIDDRANVIAYLRTLSDSPAPLPEATAAEDGAEAAPAEGEEAAPATEEAAPATEDTAPAATEPQAGEEAAPEGDTAEDGAAEGTEGAAPAQ
jgi:cytochrome c